LPSAQLPTPTAAATCNTQIRRNCRRVAGQRTIYASDLNKTLEYQLNVRSSIKIKFISFAKERRKKTIKGNLFVLRFRLHSKV